MATIVTRLDFVVRVHPKYFLLDDTSHWGMIENAPAIMQVTRPFERQPVVFTWTKNSTNVYNSENLLLDCPTCNDHRLSYIQDGVYDFKLIGSPSVNFKSLSILSTWVMKKELNRMFLEGFDENDVFGSKNMFKALEINKLLAAAKAHLREGNRNGCLRFFHKAEAMLNKFKNCKDCSHGGLWL